MVKKSTLISKYSQKTISSRNWESFEKKNHKNKGISVFHLKYINSTKQPFLSLEDFKQLNKQELPNNPESNNDIKQRILIASS